MTDIAFDNLDALDSDELDELAKILGDLQKYARFKAQAIRMRLSGDVRTALSYETLCDYIYNELPDNAKW